MPTSATDVEPLQICFGPENHPSANPVHHRVAVIVLDQGKPVVVLDHALIRRLEATIRAVPRDAAALVLCSAAPRAFVAGADLKSIRPESEGGLSDGQLHRYLAYGSKVFGMLSDLPFPTAAAIQGAALGGGLELAMHCDGLIGSPNPSGKPYPVGLPEAGLQICPGWGGTNLLPARIDPTEAIRRAASGQTMSHEEARGVGLFDVWVDDPAQLLPAACDWVLHQKTPIRDGSPSRCIEKCKPGATLEALDRVREALPETQAAEAVASCVDAGVTGGWREALELERKRLVQLRNAEAGRNAIRAFFEQRG